MLNRSGSFANFELDENEEFSGDVLDDEQGSNDIDDDDVMSDD